MAHIIKPYFEKNNIPIVLACDNNYVPFTSVLLTSLKMNISDSYNYDILLFEKDITDENKKLLTQCLNNRPNISLRFIDISQYIKRFVLRTFSYYSVEIYFRLFAPWILTKFDKILYFDCDLVFNADIAELYNIDIGNNYLGAVRDIGILLHKNNPNSGINKNYYTDFLNGVDIENYFNSGVLIMNLKKFRDELILENIMHLIMSKKWHFPDQDVLNVICGKQTKILSSSWNAIPENSGDRNLQNLLLYVDQEYVNEYLATKANPYIIHYAMKEKPWKYSINLDYQLGQYFWKYAFFSPSILEVLRIKSKTCTFAELEKIIKLFRSDAISIEDTTNDIIYRYNGIPLTRYSSKNVKFETADFDKNYFYIDGWFSVSHCEHQVDAVFIGCSNFKIKCDIFNKHDDDLFGEEIIGSKYVFKVKIPLKNLNKKTTLKIIFKIGNKYITATSYNYGRFFPVDRLFSEQYFFKNNYMLQATSKSITIQPSTVKIKRKQEKHLLCQLKQHRTENSEIKKAIKLRKIYNFCKPLCNKQIWLISDNFLSDDNGVAFFEYLYNKNPLKIKYFFAISKNNARYSELKNKYKSKVLTYGTLKFKLYSLLADIKLSSIVDMYFNRPFKSLEHFGRDIYARQKFIFLQHGVTSNDISREHNKYVYSPAAFITTSELEKKELQTDKYFYEKNDILLTGLARFDKLYNDDKKYITIMPTWRKYLIYKEGKRINISYDSFKDSSYFKFYSSLLNDKKLNKCASKLGYTLCLMQHPLFIDYNDCFKCEGNSFKILNESHRDAFAHSSLILTDYSSVIFDFLYLKKPIIYTHFDRDEFYSGNHAYDKGFIDHENDGFGECEYTLEGTINRLCEYMENNCLLKTKFEDKINDFFAYNDNNNSERIYLATKKIADENQYKNLAYFVRRFKFISQNCGLSTALKLTFKNLRNII